jgi:hypothetical protein
VIFPPLTNDGSTATLGREFAGQKGQCGGTALAADGSNINPVALALLNYKLPDRTYLIPSPQTVQGNVGTSVFSIPPRFTDDQALEGVDYLISPRNRVGVRCFWSWDPETQSFTLSNVPGAAL